MRILPLAGTSYTIVTFNMHGFLMRECLRCLVIGSGLAGLTLALQLDKKLRVALISKSTLQGGASWLAQGGIAAVF